MVGFITFNMESGDKLCINADCIESIKKNDKFVEIGKTSGSKVVLEADYDEVIKIIYEVLSKMESKLL